MNLKYFVVNDEQEQTWSPILGILVLISICLSE